MAISRDQMARELAELAWQHGRHLDLDKKLRIVGAFGSLFGRECIAAAFEKLKLYDQAFPF
jgi:hypothetical protein